jgi:hypothetical protein
VYVHTFPLFSLTPVGRHEADPDTQHCTFAAPSACTARVVHAYFANGTLPEPGTQCEQDYQFFEKPSRYALAERDEITKAMWTLSEKADFGLGWLRQ